MSRLMKLRTPLIWLGLGLFIGVSLVLVWFDLLSPVLPRVIYLFASILLLVGLLWLTKITTMWLVSKSKKLKDENRKNFMHWPIFFCLEVPVVLALFLAGAIVANWWIGASIRASNWVLDTFPLLPPGNLLFAGKVSLTYAIVIAMLVIGLILTVKKRSDESAAQPKRQRAPRQPRRERPAKAKVEDTEQTSSFEEVQNLFQTGG